MGADCKAQTNTIPSEDSCGEVHEKKAGKTCTVFHPDAAEAVKFDITNTLKKPNRVIIWNFFCESGAATLRTCLATVFYRE